MILFVTLSVNEDDPGAHRVWGERIAELEAREAECKQDQGALMQSHYRLVAENVADVVWTVDMNLRPTYVSPSVTRVLGYDSE